MENESHPIERGPELSPTHEEIEMLFEELIGGREYDTRRQSEDEQGVYLWEVVVNDAEDGHTEYGYMRAGQHAEGEASVSAVHVTFFDGDGVPIGGHRVARYENGEWRTAS